MADMMDKMKDKAGGEMGDRAEQLKSHVKNDMLGDKGKKEQEKLKGQSEQGDSQ